MIVIFKTAQAKLASAPLAQRFLRGAAWSVFGSLLSSSVNLLMLMLLARLLGKETYGQFVVIQSTLSTVGVFAGFGIGTVATRYSAELRKTNPARLGHILTLAERTTICFGVIASTSLAFGGELMATSILNAPELSLPIAISASAILFTALDSYQKSVLIGFESLRAMAMGTITGSILGFPLMLVAASSYELAGSATAMVVIAVLQMGISRYQMSKELQNANVKLGAKGSLVELPVLWRFAFPALLSSALVGPAHWATQVMLANTPNGYAELAVLGVAMQWFTVVMFVPGMAGRVVLPMLTEHVTHHDHSNSRIILRYAIAANAIVTVPMAMLIAILSPYIMCLYGASFSGQNTPLILAAITATILAILTPVANLLAAKSHMWLGALMNAGWAFVYLGLASSLSGKGATGIMLSLVTAYIVHTLWTFAYANHQINREMRTYT